MHYVTYDKASAISSSSMQGTTCSSGCPEPRSCSLPWTGRDISSCTPEWSETGGTGCVNEIEGAPLRKLERQRHRPPRPVVSLCSPLLSTILLWSAKKGERLNVSPPYHLFGLLFGDQTWGLVHLCHDFMLLSIKVAESRGAGKTFCHDKIQMSVKIDLFSNITQYKGSAICLIKTAHQIGRWPSRLENSK